MKQNKSQKLEEYIIHETKFPIKKNHNKKANKKIRDPLESSLI